MNLPVVGAAGSFGFSILTSDFMLDLELSALQAESKGEIIATPRVITSNQTKAMIEQGVEILISRPVPAVRPTLPSKRRC
ncbi:MAG: hypothetical protein R3E95_19135 [Thiolinea sp.]